MRTVRNLSSKWTQTIFSISFIKYVSYCVMRGGMTQTTQILLDTAKITHAGWTTDV